MDWIAIAIIIGSICYLFVIVRSFMKKHRESRDRIEQTLIDIQRLETQLKESEQARTGTEDRGAKLEEESLTMEQEISALQQKINAAIPKGGDTA